MLFHFGTLDTELVLGDRAGILDNQFLFSNLTGHRSLAHNVY